jgi:hypothetical protein
MAGISTGPVTTEEHQGQKHEWFTGELHKWKYVASNWRFQPSKRVAFGTSHRKSTVLSGLGVYIFIQPHPKQVSTFWRKSVDLTICSE